jgi:ribose transport system ATP-binding protein
MNQPTPTLSITGLRKSFGPTEVLHGIDLEVRGGEFVGLMGPNGAGKSTLIKILDGVYTSSAGEISFDGKTVDAIGGRHDIGFIHQDLGLIDDMSIAENLRLGEPPLRLIGPILDHRAERRSAEEAIGQIGLDLSVDTIVGDLAPGEKTLVAVARAFARGAQLIFVDEATSTLPPSDSRRVVDALTESVGRGVSVVMVTHKLNELLRGPDRIVLLIDGQVAADEPTAELDQGDLIGMLTSHHAAERSQDEHEPSDADAATGTGEPVLTMVGACGGRAGPIDLELRAGQIFGLTGLPGSGLHDVAFLADGSLLPTAGTVEFRSGVRTALVPPHRESQGGFGELSVRQNVTISALKRWRSAGFLVLPREQRDAQEMIERLQVVPNDLEAEFGTLSGGNRQKVIFGRALFQQPDLYVLCEPTRGVDVGTRLEIYKLIRELGRQGAAVLVVSSDTEDLMAVCGQVAAITEGGISEVRMTREIGATEMEDLL